MEAATQTQTKPRTFVHQCPNQILFVETPRYKRNAQGDRIGEDQGKQIQFENNVFVADEAAAAKLDMPLDELLDFLRSHEMFQAVMFEDYLPEEQEPSVTQQTRDIFAAQQNLDAEAIKRIIDGERETHNRTAVIELGTAALEELARNPG